MASSLSGVRPTRSDHRFPAFGKVAPSQRPVTLNTVKPPTFNVKKNSAYPKAVTEMNGDGETWHYSGDDLEAADSIRRHNRYPRSTQFHRHIVPDHRMM
jgi:hypothetical protein